jgi:hypothetical protein
MRVKRPSRGGGRSITCFANIPQDGHGTNRRLIDFGQ